MANLHLPSWFQRRGIPAPIKGWLVLIWTPWFLALPGTSRLLLPCSSPSSRNSSFLLGHPCQCSQKLSIPPHLPTAAATSFMLIIQNRTQNCAVRLFLLELTPIWFPSIPLFSRSQTSSLVSNALVTSLTSSDALSYEIPLIFSQNSSSVAFLCFNGHYFSNQCPMLTASKFGWDSSFLPRVGCSQLCALTSSGKASECREMHGLQTREIRISRCGVLALAGFKSFPGDPYVHSGLRTTALGGLIPFHGFIYYYHKAKLLLNLNLQPPGGAPWKNKASLVWRELLVPWRHCSTPGTGGGVISPNMAREPPWTPVTPRTQHSEEQNFSFRNIRTISQIP